MRCPIGLGLYLNKPYAIIEVTLYKTEAHIAKIYPCALWASFMIVGITIIFIILDGFLKLVE